MSNATAILERSQAANISQNETLFEYISSGNRKPVVDREKNQISNVKILGFESVNGRTYKKEAVRNARPMYEGAKVNLNHPRGQSTAARDYQDRLGHLSNVIFDESAGLFGVYNYNPKHPLAEQLLWDAEHAPQNVGFSHNVLARTSEAAGKKTIEEIVKVFSVDLVADPATNSSLYEGVEGNGSETETRKFSDILTETTAESFERKFFTSLFEDDAAMGDMPVTYGKGTASDGQIKAGCRAMMLAIIDDAALDTKTALSKIKKIFDTRDAIMSDTNKSADDKSKAAAATESVAITAEEAKTLREENAMLKAKDSVRGVAKELKKSITEAQVDVIAAIPVEASRKVMIEALPEATAIEMPRSASPLKEGKEAVTEGEERKPAQTREEWLKQRRSSR